MEVHKEFGGVVPELAARSHIEKIDWIVKKAIDESGRKIEEIDAVASTAGPGLIVCLSVGLSFGKAFATSMNKPFIAVNHLEGHSLSPKQFKLSIFTSFNFRRALTIFKCSEPW